MNKNKVFIGMLAVAALLASCGQNGGKTEKTANLSGAGATFPAPFYNIVLKNFTEKSDSKVTYGAVGSGGGIRSLKDQTVDFGATDVFLSDAELAEMGGEVLHIPTCLGAVVVSYNLKEISELKLTSALISEIFRGKITRWNDQKIKAINHNLNLPDKAITAVYRSDGSGTTAVFSEYMAKVDEAWNAEIGVGKSLKFSVGVAAKGNPGVAGVVAETDGAIGYIGSEYAFALNLPMASLQNSSGNFVQATDKSISAAAEAEIPADTRASITNSSNSEAYPVSTFTWLIVFKEQNYNKRTTAQAKSLQQLLTYITSAEGQEIAVKTHYASLPETVAQKTATIIQSMTYDNKPIE
ncbi:MAG: phosphate ABC transporter substrate-binding protein PstS [Prevotellaceae bacterium]|jgi:phosphate transport system substrate-binding protein|nr:phosphate ABC transporter substrate-binding protein PstS [Prevotellaceae bacterium]